MVPPERLTATAPPAPVAESPLVLGLEALPPGPTYRCPCAHAFHVHGSGRHRIYFERDDRALANPVMNRACSACGRRLPSKGRPYAMTAAVAM